MLREELKKIKFKYFINDKEVRARDVQTFFADLSTGAHPVLISQGKIGQLVIRNLSNENILEEAAGISEFMLKDKS